MSDISQLSHDKRYVMCATCLEGRPTMATYECTDCYDPLCADCAAFHTRTKVTKDHKIVDLTEFDNVKFEKRIMIKKLTKCMVHKKEKIIGLCYECNQTVCQICVSKSHKGHSVMEKKDSEKEKCTMEEMEATEDSILNIEELLLSKESKELEMFTEAETGITKRFEELVILLQQRKDDLLDKVNEKHNKNKELVESLQTRLSSSKEDYNHYNQLSKYIFDEANNNPVVEGISDAITSISFIDKVENAIKDMKQVKEDIETMEYEEMVFIPGITTEIDLGSLKEIKSIADAKPLQEEIEKNTLFSAPKPVMLPKPQPRHLRHHEMKETAIIAPIQSVKSHEEIGDLEKFNTSPAPKPLQRKSLFEITKLMNENQHKSMEIEDNSPPIHYRRQFKSVTDLASENETDQNTNIIQSASFQISPRLKAKRVAPSLPIKKQEETWVKRIQKPSPVNRKTQQMKPNKLDLRRSQSNVTMLSTEAVHPINAEFIFAFGKKGRLITTGEISGPPQCLYMHGCKNKILLLDGHYVMVYSQEGWYKKSLRIAIPNPLNPGSFAKPISLGLLSTKQLVVLYKRFVAEWSWDGTLINTWGRDELQDAHGLAIDNNDRIIVTDQEKHNVLVFDCKSSQKIVQIGGFGEGDNQFKSPRYVCTNSRNQIYVSDHHNHCVKVFTSRGKFITKFGGKGDGPGQLKYPEIISLYRRGNSEGILVADEGNNRLSLFTCDGKFVNHVKTVNGKFVKSPKCLSVSQSTAGKMVITYGTNIPIEVFNIISNCCNTLNECLSSV